MKVMVIVKASKDSEAGEMPSQQLLTEMGQFNEALAKAGIIVDGAGLHPSSKGARVRFSGKHRSVMDGPFAETKELIAGYWLWKVNSMQEAIEWVKKCPNPMNEDSDIEIRPVFEAEDFGEAFTPELREQEAAVLATGLGLGFPRFEDRLESRIGGLNASYTTETRIRIPQQWDRFAPYMGKVPGRVGSDSFGVCWDAKPNCDFQYLTGVEIADASQLPADFVSVKVAAGRYAVFAHTGHASSIAKMIDAIWQQWVPKSGLKISPGPCFERYTAEFNVRTGLGGMEFWVPLMA
jgi:AraC family transcriptional regulator